MDYLFWLSQAFSSYVWLQPAATSSSCLPYSYSPSYHEFLPANLLMLLLCSSFLRVCYCTHGRLHFCGYMRGSSQLSSGSSQLSSARALLCMSTLKERKCEARSRLQSMMTESNNLNMLTKHFVLLPTQEAHHSFHKTSGEVGFSQKIHPKLVEKINELVSEGAVTTQEVKRALKRHVHHVLCPHQTIEASNRTYFPTETDIRNHIYSAQKALEMSKFDQDNLMLKIDQWEKGNPTSKFYFCAYKDHENLSEENAELMPPHHINFFMSTRSNGSSSF